MTISRTQQFLILIPFPELSLLPQLLHHILALLCKNDTLLLLGSHPLSRRNFNQILSLFYGSYSKRFDISVAVILLIISQFFVYIIANSALIKN
jgi:hypothetical protein